MTRKSVLLVATLLMAVALGAGTARATVYSWNDAGGGVFDIPGNWLPSGIPGSSDTAKFGLNAKYEVLFDSHEVSNDFEVTAGTVTFDMFYDNTPPDPDYAFWYTLNATSGGAANITGTSSPATLVVHGGYAYGGDPYGGRSTIATSSYLHIGRDVGKTGTLDLQGARWLSTHNTFVGLEGTGNLLIGYYSYVTNVLGVLGFSAGSSGTATVSGTWTNNGDFYVGVLGTGTLDIYNAVSNTGDAFIASGTGSIGNVTVDDGTWTDGFWSTDGSLYVGGTSGGAGGTGTLTIAGADSEVTVANDIIIHSTGTVTMFDGTLSTGTLTGAAGTMTWSGGQITITGGDLAIDADTPFGANLSMGSSHGLDVAGALKIGVGDMANVLALSGATITSNTGEVGGADPGVFLAGMLLAGSGTTWTMTGDLSVGGAGALGADLSISQEAVVTNQNAFVASTAGTTAEMEVLLAGAQWNSSGSVYLGGDATTLGGSGTLDVNDLAAMSVGGTMKIWDDFAVTVDGGSLTTPVLEVAGSFSYSGTLDLSGSGPIGSLVLDGGTVAADLIDFGDIPFAGHGALVGGVVATATITATGDLALGDINSYTGAQLSGNLVVGSHTVTVNKAGFFSIGLFTDISGGTLNVPGGVAIPVGNSLVAFGAINGRLAAQSGSTIDAAGNLSLGDAASPAGFFSNGELSVHDHTVTIHDANQAVLGSLTTLGEGASQGTLVAANGAVVEFGKNLVGFGTVDTPNDPAKPLINNGAIVGNSADEPITLTGFVKGVGTCDNVTFTGTFSPGFSPAELSAADIAFADTATLIIELGGLNPGSEYDVVNVTGNVTLDGTLAVQLIDGFTPGVGDEFTIMRYAERDGEFDNYSGLELGGGLTLSPNYAATELVLETTCAQIPGDANGDGQVTDADAGILATNWQACGMGWSEGDFNGDGCVTDADAAILATHWQEGVEAAAPVPEPSVLVLLLGVAAAFVRSAPIHRGFRGVWTA